jgi:amino acid permease
MKDLSYIGWSIVCAAIALDIIISSRVNKKLSPEQKIQIADLNLKTKIYLYIWIAIIFLFIMAKAFISSLKVFPLIPSLKIASILILIVLMFVYVKKRIKLNLPTSYIKTKIFTEMILLAAFIFLFGFDLV